MVEELLTPLKSVIKVVDTLLEEDTFNDMQRTFLYNISTEAHKLQSVLLTIPDLSYENAKHLLSFEGRSHLSSVIGYTEELIEEAEGQLNDEQGTVLEQVRNKSIHLLEQLEAVIE